MALFLLLSLLLPLLVDLQGRNGVSAAWHPRQDAPPALLRRIVESGNSRALEDRSSSSSSSSIVEGGRQGLAVSPLDFGGDPTGGKDSYEWLAQCVKTCVNFTTVLDPLGHFTGDYSFHNGHAIRNSGGCEIDLGGAEYLTSKPVKFPEYVGNINFGHGSLTAASNFSGDFLIVVGIEGSCKVPQGSCNVDLNFPELFLDGRHVASGMQINNVMGSTLGPGGYILNFTEYGVQINAGHEVMIDRCWLGETNFDFPFDMEHPPRSTAIQINGHDHFVLNTIVFSSKVGLEVSGSANVLTNVHVWFPENRALAFVDIGVMAFHIVQRGNRFSGCYIDGSRAVQANARDG